MYLLNKSYIRILIILTTGILFGLLSQLFVKSPADRYIHIRNFRYGKDPHVIRCNRGDRLHITFSSDDTGHSFFLEEFDVDAKINPSSDEVAVFKTSDPTAPPVYTKELVITADHPGFRKYIVSKSNNRCHVWCGPMHAFEQGKLIIMPNSTLFFGLGGVMAILLIWFVLFTSKNGFTESVITGLRKREKEVNPPWLRKLLVSRWPQIILMLIALIMITLVVTTSLVGTKVSGRNLGVLLMWSVWLFLLIAILTPLGGRVWCTVCPLPVFGDLIQRGSLFLPLKGKKREYNNRFFGMFHKWPLQFDNSWLRIFVFMILSTLSTTLVANPRMTGITVVVLCILPVLMSLIWELRSFCRYICPVPAFVVPFSKMSIIYLRNRSQEVCDNCRPKYCRNGNTLGWACPYGINLGEVKDYSECGLCLECIRSCSFENVTIARRSFCSGSNPVGFSKCWLNVAIFATAIVYSILYLGPWPQVREWINITDKQNWDQFGLYSIITWLLILVFLPGIILSLAYSGKMLSGSHVKTGNIFKGYTESLLPLGLMLWIAFVIPMLFVNLTFIKQSLSDPFGWGWDFFGTANTPWHQFLPHFVPWFQALAVLTGLYLSLRNLPLSWTDGKLPAKKQVLLYLPQALFLTGITVFMIFFFTN